MSIQDEFNQQFQAPRGNRNTLGQAANRWVTWQIATSIVSGIVGLIVFLLFLFLFFLPAWNSFPGP